MFKGVTFSAGAVVALLGFSGTAKAHPGALDASGCHHDRKAGTSHCHGGKAKAGEHRHFQSFGGKTEDFSSRYRRGKK